MNGSKELSEIKDLFNDSIPLIFSVMADKEVLPSFWPLYKDFLLDDKGIQNPLVKQGIMVALSSRCSSDYCFVSHSYYLYGLGFTVDTIETLVSELKFPSEVDDNEKWSLVLKWAFLFGRTSGGFSDASDDSEKPIRRIISADEYLSLFKICSINDFLNRFSEFYSNSIRVEDEELFLDPTTELKLPIPDLVKYYHKVSEKESDAERPVVAICMYCKNVRDNEGKWHSLESVLSALDRGSLFSHGICPDCYDKTNG